MSRCPELVDCNRGRVDPEFTSADLFACELDIAAWIMSVPFPIPGSTETVAQVVLLAGMLPFECKLEELFEGDPGRGDVVGVPPFKLIVDKMTHFKLHLEESLAGQC